MSKPRPERVIPEIARGAVYDTDQRISVWTFYILRHYRSTGNLAPGCDLRDLMAWLEVNEPMRLAAITSPSQVRRKKT